MANERVNGVAVKIGGVDYILPGIPLVKLALCKPFMDGGNVMEETAFAECFIDALYWSLLRNYPQIDRQTIVNSVDLINYGELLKAIQKANGLEKKKDGVGGAAASQ